MKTVLVFSLASAIRDRLLEEFSQNFEVQAASSHVDIIENLKEESWDVVVVEARRDYFAILLRAIIAVRPGAQVYLFQDTLVFCQYPLNRRPVAVAHAFERAGLLLPGGAGAQPRAAPSAATVQLNA